MSPSSLLSELKTRLQTLANEETAKTLQTFFKTAPGEYAEGDILIGIKVPPLRQLAAEFQDTPLHVVKSLLRSKIHEERTLALMILVRQFTRGGEKLQERLYRFYMAHTRYISNWDLVDGSAPYIAGAFLVDRSRAPLYLLAKSSSIWERRIAILSTLHFIRRDEYEDALKIARILLVDEHDLIHKAVGWMLREIGKRDRNVEEKFLKSHYRRMPRTMLRYAIERFPEARRRQYLLGKV